MTTAAVRRLLAAGVGALLCLFGPTAVSAKATADLYRAGVEARADGRLEDAAALFEQLLARDPRHVDALFMLGTVYAFLERYDAAGALLKQSLAIAPDYAGPKLALARLLSWQGRYDEAVRLTDEVLSAEPGRADAWLLRGRIAFYREDLDGAEARFLEAQRLDPRGSESLVGLGDVAAARRRTEQAHDYWQQAKAFDPGSEAAADRLARGPSDGGSPEADRRFRVDMGGRYSTIDQPGFDDWREAYARVMFRAAEGWDVYYHGEAAERFDAADDTHAFGAVRTLRDGLTLEWAVAVTPDADFREVFALSAGVTARLRQSDGNVGDTILVGRLRHSRYPDVELQRGAVGIEQYVLDGQLWGRVELMGTRADDDVIGGWSARIDLAPAFAKGGSVHVGYAAAPEAMTGDLTDVRSVFGGLTVPLTPEVDLRLDLAHHRRDGSYRRFEGALGVTVRF